MLLTWRHLSLGLITLGCLSCATEDLPDDKVALSTASTESPPAEWDREIRMSDATDEDATPAVVEVSLTAAVTRVPTGADGEQVERWTYNGTVPGPLIRAHVGDRLRVHFRNQLPEPTTIHWHGLEVPAAMDGADPQHASIAPGESFDYEFVVPHAGTYWYHPHMNSAAQLWRGLYGALIVDGVDEPELGAEAVLMLSDLAVQDGHLQPVDPNDLVTAFFGRRGELVQVNGQSLPTLRVRAGTALRLRFINAAIARYFLLAVDGHPLARVAGDSGFLERPEMHESILVVPGERTEAVLVPHGSVGSSVLLQALPFSRFDCGGSPCDPTVPLMRIEIVQDGGAAKALPERLATIAPIDVSEAVEHTIAMTQNERSNGTGAFGLNNQLYPEDPLMLNAQVGETHLWTLDNQTDYDHPFHLHGFRFQVLERDGKAPSVAEWKDTLNLPHHSMARIAVTFDDRPGMWMLHCHILDHADLGMMGMLQLSQPAAMGQAEHVH